MPTEIGFRFLHSGYSPRTVFLLGASLLCTSTNRTGTTIHKHEYSCATGRSGSLPGVDSKVVGPKEIMTQMTQHVIDNTIIIYYMQVYTLKYDNYEN